MDTIRRNAAAWLLAATLIVIIALGAAACASAAPEADTGKPTNDGYNREHAFAAIPTATPVSQHSLDAHDFYATRLPVLPETDRFAAAAAMAQQAYDAAGIGRCRAAYDELTGALATEALYRQHGLIAQAAEQLESLECSEHDSEAIQQGIANIRNQVRINVEATRTAEQQEYQRQVQATAVALDRERKAQATQTAQSAEATRSAVAAADEKARREMIAQQDANIATDTAVEQMRHMAEQTADHYEAHVLRPMEHHEAWITHMLQARSTALPHKEQGTDWYRIHAEEWLRLQSAEFEYWRKFGSGCDQYPYEKSGGHGYGADAGAVISLIVNGAVTRRGAWPNGNYQWLKETRPDMAINPHRNPAYPPILEITQELERVKLDQSNNLRPVNLAADAQTALDHLRRLRQLVDETIVSTRLSAMSDHEIREHRSDDSPLLTQPAGWRYLNASIHADYIISQTHTAMRAVCSLSQPQKSAYEWLE